MQSVAEVLRWALISLQIALIYWMISSRLWRHLPCWTLWLAGEAASRILFHPGGNYWHGVWIPFQALLMTLLLMAAVEAKYQMRKSEERKGLITVGMGLGEVVKFRAGLHLAIALVLILPPRGHGTAKGHGLLLALVCFTTAVLSWLPATGEVWWTMRSAYLGVYSLACLAWLGLFTAR